MKKAVIFDLDGTLLDTSVGIIKSIRYTIKKMGLEALSDEQLKSFIGPPIKKRMMEIYGMTEKKATEAMNIFRNHYGQSDIFEADLYDGLIDLLVGLKVKGYWLGVATYKREDQAIELLDRKNISKYFDVIHGSDVEGKLSKADIVRLCIQELDTEPFNIVMIGDSDNDALGAQEASTKFIGVTYGFGFKGVEEVRSYTNIGVATSCEEISNLL